MNIRAIVLVQEKAARLQNRLIPNYAEAFLLMALCLLSFFYALICLTDLYSAYAIKTNTERLIIQQQQLASVAQQVDKLELAVKNRKIKHSKLYDDVLFREGRLTERHIVNRGASRLMALSRDGASPVYPYLTHTPDNFDITMPSTVTAYELEQVLAGTQLRGLGRSFVHAELFYGINAIFLTALAIHESRWGNSPIAQDKHNLFGFAAYDADPYRNAAIFQSKPECIYRVTRYIRDNYIDGPQSPGRSIADIGARYATDPGWSGKVHRLMLQINDSILSKG